MKKNLCFKAVAFTFGFIFIMIGCDGPNDGELDSKRILTGPELSGVVNQMTSYRNLVKLMVEKDEQINSSVQNLSSEDKAKLANINGKYSDYNDFLENASAEDTEFLNAVMEFTKDDELKSNFVSLIQELSSLYIVDYKELSGIVNMTKGDNTKDRTQEVDCVAIANVEFWNTVDYMLAHGHTPDTAYLYGMIVYNAAYNGCMAAVLAGG